MPDVVADTSPLQYLHHLTLLGMLHQWYDTVVVPEAVLREIEYGATEGANVPRVSGVPWIQVEAVPDGALHSVSRFLGRGEREVIGLALTKRDPLVLLDDRSARHEAQRLSIPFTGVLGILLRAKREAVFDRLAPLLDRLQRHGFYLDPQTRAYVLQLAGEIS